MSTAKKKDRLTNKIFSFSWQWCCLPYITYLLAIPPKCLPIASPLISWESLWAFWRPISLEFIMLSGANQLAVISTSALWGVCSLLPPLPNSYQVGLFFKLLSAVVTCFYLTFICLIRLKSHNIEKYMLKKPKKLLIISNLSRKHSFGQEISLAYFREFSCLFCFK